MSAPRPPKNLPRGYRSVWNALSIADQRVASRKTLANELGVATHTIQRILVDGDVPRFPETKNVRIVHAWVRSLTRLAERLGASPKDWIKEVGIQWDAAIEEVSDSELAKGPAPRRRWRAPGEAKLPRGWPRDTLRVALGSVSPYGDPLTTFQSSFLAAYLHRVAGAIDPSLRIDLRTMHEIEVVDAVSADDPEIHVGIGALETFQRRSKGLEFQPIPGCRIRLGAVGIQAKDDPRPPPRWSDIVPPSRAPYSYLVHEGGTAEYFLKGQCAIPRERLLSAPRDSLQLPQDFITECRARDLKLVFVSTEDECRSMIRSLSSLPELGEGHVAAALEGSPNELPSYPVSLMWTSRFGDWARLLRPAQEIELFRNSFHQTALLYADLLATSYLQPIAPSAPAGGWDAPFADRIALAPRAGRGGWSPVASFPQASIPFLDSLCLRLVAILADGMTAQLAARLEAGRPEENRSRIIQRIKGDALRIVPMEWIPRLVSTLEKVTAGENDSHHETEAKRRTICHSCSAFLADGIHGGISDRYCRFCSDEGGRLKAREAVEELLSLWIGSWDRRLDSVEARERAVAYMEKMPAWSGN